MVGDSDGDVQQRWRCASSCQWLEVGRWQRFVMRGHRGGQRWLSVASVASTMMCDKEVALGWFASDRRRRG
ncbi:hypothetical protein Nepgr_008773 [Nepenthes gracilis]|uniref:Uncharacterized protein n=1 Tax=Nepenthes gracilis TaxID=150966 RepID=A0AAD3S9A0_NEPGR|nr:hypothetical protein Nepgr_008773 [Nepenthes gracilis]